MTQLSLNSNVNDELNMFKCLTFRRHKTSPYVKRVVRVSYQGRRFLHFRLKSSAMDKPSKILLLLRSGSSDPDGATRSTTPKSENVVEPTTKHSVGGAGGVVPPPPAAAADLLLRAELDHVDTQVIPSEGPLEVDAKGYAEKMVVIPTGETRGGRRFLRRRSFRPKPTTRSLIGR